MRAWGKNGAYFIRDFFSLFIVPYEIDSSFPFALRAPAYGPLVCIGLGWELLIASAASENLNHGSVPRL